MIDLQEMKNKIFSKDHIYSILIIVIIFTLDRYSKIQIINNFSSSTFYVNDFINLDLVWNTGIGFGLFSSGSSFLYNLITLIIGIVILILLIINFKSENFEKIIFATIIGGAFGNFYDRIHFKAVPDFIDLHYGNFHWFTFNAADIFITIGIIGFILKEIFVKSN